MSLYKYHDHQEQYSQDFSYEQENPEELMHRKKIRRLLEDRLEKKRLREEIDELDGDFDWDELDRP